MKNNIVSLRLIGLALFCWASQVQAQQMFDSYSVSELVHRLYENDQLYLDAKAAVQQSAYREKAAFGSLLPRVTLDLVGRQVDRSRPNGTLYSDNNVELKVTQPLLNAASWSQSNSAELERALSEAILIEQEQDMLLRFVQVLMAIFRSDDELGSFVQQEKLLAVRLEKITSEVEQGRSPGVDKDKVSAEYLLIRAQRAKQQSARLDSVAAMQELTRGVPANSSLKEDIELTLPEPDDLRWWQNEARTNNSAVLVIQKEIELSRARLELYESEYYPLVDLYLSHKYYETDIADDLQVTEENTIGLQLSLPLYEGGSTLARTDEAQAALAQVMRSQEHQLYRLHNQVQSLWVSLKATLELLTAQANAVEAAQLAFDNERLGNELGTSNTYQVLESQAAYFDSRREFLSLRYDFILDLFTLHQAAGKLNREFVVRLLRRYTADSDES